MPPFQPEGDGAGACPYTAFVHRSLGSYLDGFPNLLDREGTLTDIVEPRVVALADHCVDRYDLLVAVISERPDPDRLCRPRHAERVGQYDRRLDLASSAICVEPISLP